MKNYLAAGLIILLLPLFITLAGCEDTDDPLATLAPYLVALEDEAQEGPIQWSIDTSDNSFNAFSDFEHHEIILTQGFVDALKSGKIDIAQALFVLCHEIGHFNPHGHERQGGTHDEEFADFYGLLLWDEFNTDMKLGLDEYDAIEVFHTAIHSRGGDGIHPASEVRFQYLKAKLDYWKAHEGEIEAG